LDLIGTYSDPSRDPRGHIISVVFHLRLRGGLLKAGDDADGVSLHELSDLPELAFDHRKIIMDFLASAAKRKN
jgi:8-oxo-dGTP diphosphatase